VKLLTSIYDDARLLPHFLRHYEALGVSQVFCVAQVDQNPALLDEIAAHTLGHQFVVEHVLQGTFHPGPVYQRLDAVRQRYVRPDEWVVCADLDEFLDASVPIAELVARCEDAGADHVKGVLVDRIAADGTFPPLGAGPLGAQFPLAAALTGKLLRAYVHKVPLMRGSCPVRDGLHETVGCPLDAPPLSVFHYKWFDGVKARMVDRLYTRILNGEGCWPEAKRFVDYVQNTGPRIDVTDAFWEVRRIE
jgi:hypothetical protein